MVIGTLDMERKGVVKEAKYVEGKQHESNECVCVCVCVFVCVLRQCGDSCISNAVCGETVQ